MTLLTAQLLTLSVLAMQRQEYHNRGMNRTTWNGSYDFVIVGSGTAGSIVAGRLSANPNVTVLLIEAGGPMTVISDIMPAFAFYDYTWGYSTTSQKNAAFSFRNRKIAYPLGKILGGTHTINLAGYTRGNRRDYDNWASSFGATGWTYREVLPYFLRSENNTDPKVVARYPELHSTAGPVQISTPPQPDPIALRYLNAARLLGWPNIDLANSVDQYGVAIMQTTQSNVNWTRQTTASAYIETNIYRPNLHVLVNSLVTRILFDRSGSFPRAIGVVFVRNNQTHQVMASREVIVSAGPIKTPQLLLLSGIGPTEHLSQFSIPLTANLPAGNNLQDHVLVPFNFFVRNSSDVQLGANIYHNLNVENLFNFMAHFRGPLTQYWTAETYLATGVNGNRDWPDGVMHMGITQGASDLEATLEGYDQSRQLEWRQYLSQLVDNNRHVIYAVALYRPRSRGTVRLASANPFDAPLINPEYLSDRQDLIALVRAMQIGLRILESEYMTPLVEYSRLPIPGCELCPAKPLSACVTYLICVAQTSSSSSFHPVGTAPMGNSSNSNSVVDERLRVRNVAQLRIVDASVMPTITNCNTNAPTMMIGERGAEFIAQDNGLMAGPADP